MTVRHRKVRHRKVRHRFTAGYEGFLGQSYSVDRSVYPITS